jgi:hypothetical protein
MVLYPSIRLLQLITGTPFDTSSTSGCQAATTSYTWSHTCADLSNRIMVVGVGILSALGDTVESVQYGGVNLTFATGTSTGVYRSEQWTLIAPATGTNTVLVKLSSAANSTAGAISYYNANQVSQPGAMAVNTGSGSASSVSVTPLDDVSWIVDCLTSSVLTNPTPAVTQHQRWDTSCGAGSAAQSDTGIISPAASTTMTWTGMGALDTWAMTAIVIRPFTTTAAGPPVTSTSKFLCLLGVGT